MDDRTRKTLRRDNNIVEGKPSNSEIDYDMFLMSIANHSLLRYQQGREFEKDLEAALDDQEDANSLAYLVDNLQESWESQHHQQVSQSQRADDRLPCHLRPTTLHSRYELFARPEPSQPISLHDKALRYPLSHRKVPGYISPSQSEPKAETLRYADSSMLPTYGVLPNDSLQHLLPVSGSIRQHFPNTGVLATNQRRLNACPLETKAAMTIGDVQTQSRSNEATKVIMLKRTIEFEPQESQNQSELGAEVSENINVEISEPKQGKGRRFGLGIEIPLSTSYKKKEFSRSGFSSVRGISQVSVNIGLEGRHLSPSGRLQSVYDNENIEEEAKETTLFEKVKELKVSSARRIPSSKPMHNM